MYEVENFFKEISSVVANFLKAAINGNEEYFDNWLSLMRKIGLSMAIIKNKIEKLDHEQYSVLHYTIRYHHLNLSRKLIEEFHCGIQSIK
jgi:hypothetical protein